MVRVNPEILRWARSTAMMTPEQAVEKLRIRDARGVSAVQRLTEYETGRVAPTRALLVRMAQHYRRPLLTFFLPAPPHSKERGVDFRVQPGGVPVAESANERTRPDRWRPVLTPIRGSYAAVTRFSI